MKHKILVIYDEEFGGGGITEYSGEDMFSILEKIAEDHSYAIDPQDEYDEESLLNHIDSNNGDGCDWILAMFFDGELKYSFSKVKKVNVVHER